MHALILIIHDVRSVHNVGSLFRTADGMGVSTIYLTGYTPGPIDRFGRKISAFTKVSLGAEDSVSWEHTENALALIQELKQKGSEVVALEQAPHAVPLSEYTPKENVALIVGNEVDGISQEILNAADATIEIPMKGEKESLNVANAGAIALWHLTR
mgnify:CR=1 FL=1